jgi:hypothetical protein
MSTTLASRRVRRNDNSPARQAQQVELQVGRDTRLWQTLPWLAYRAIYYTKGSESYLVTIAHGFWEVYSDKQFRGGIGVDCATGTIGRLDARCRFIPASEADLQSLASMRGASRAFSVRSIIKRLIHEANGRYERVIRSTPSWLEEAENNRKRVHDHWRVPRYFTSTSRSKSGRA